MSVEVTPWWKALKIRQEISNANGQIDDVQMSLFRAAYGTGSDRPPYADATYFGEITHPTARLVDLLAEIAVRIGGGEQYLRARAVTRLDQGMGGGKSHACVGAYHLANDPGGLFATEVGRRIAEQARERVGVDLPKDLNKPLVVVLPCDNMTPGAGSQLHDGPAVTLYERFLWRLFSRDYALYERYQPFWSDKGKISDAIRAVNRPVLIIVDEILDYVGNGLDGARRPDLVAQDMAFLRALLDVVNDVPHVALLAVMIASDADKTALSPAARDRRDDINTLLERNGTPATVTEVSDFASILRRRLFETDPPAELLSATAEQYSKVLQDKAWSKNVWETVASGWKSRWHDEVAASYPFHPMLMAMAKEEWSQVTGFQRVRSTIRIFAATVFVHEQRAKAGGWVPLLIGPGDLPLGESNVREALLGSGLVEDDRTIANYRSLAEIEIINNDGTAGTARLQDLQRPSEVWQQSNPRAAERAATYILVASVVGTLRPGRGRGASALEVKAATSVPDAAYTLTDADGVLEALVSPSTGMSAIEVLPGQGNNKPARYFLSTRLTHRMLVNNIRRTITDAERDEVIATTAQKLVTTGPFRELKFVKADLARSAADVISTAGIDSAHSTRLVVLDPAQYSLRNGMEEATLGALTRAMGLSSAPGMMPIQWASSAVFAVVNTQRRALTRSMAVEYLARQKALEAPEIQRDAELRAVGIKDLAEAKSNFERHLKRAYQHVVYLAQPDPDGERFLEQMAFDDEHSTALDGTIVWKSLAERDKVFDNGQFNARALLHNLRDSDDGKSLADIRSSFYSAPRLPLLFSGESDLRQAIHDAVDGGEIDIVDASDESVAITTANQVNLASTALRLRLRQPADTAPSSTDEKEKKRTVVPEEGTTQFEVEQTHVTARQGITVLPAANSSAQVNATTSEQQVSFSLTQNLLGDQSASDDLATVFKALYTALDEGHITYLQSTIQMVAPSESIADIRDALLQLGVQVNTKQI